VKLLRLPARSRSAPASQRARGADFSSFQSEAATRAAIARGLAFGIVKLTQGAGYVNPLARTQVKLLREDGAVVGLYHFLEPHIDGARQWDHFEQTLRASLLYAGVLVAVDHEPLNGVLPADAVARAFIRRGQHRGFRVGRYGSSGTTMRYVLGENWRWVAQWTASPPAGRWDVWQFSGTGQDWNVFRGDRAQLHAWAAAMATPAPPKPRWWIHDVTTKHALGPYRLARVAPAFLTYAARHPRSTHYTLERT
jgi:GH25 family lysozyme M1 (1,4-beta-N-acetylmuramidase)